MNRVNLAERLVDLDVAGWDLLLDEHRHLIDLALARELKTLYDRNESSDPSRAATAAAALEKVSLIAADPESLALATWTAGMAALDTGEMDRAIIQLDEAEERFTALGQPVAAASTQVSKLIALAMLGRYDEAIVCGLRARDVFVVHNDVVSAGKIEQNLGNIYGRRDRHAESERLFRSARERFLTAGNRKQLAQIENNLAIALKWQHKFREAATYYEQALDLARAEGLELTQAEIECNLGLLALFQGRYHHALDYLERSRRRYIGLGMAHKTAIAEQELAEAYLELNLASEAASIYERVTPVFAELGMRAEQCRALADHGRACLMLGQLADARHLLASARVLFAIEGNAVGEATVTLTEARIQYATGNYDAAGAAAADAEAPLLAAGIWGRLLHARWLRAETARVRERSAEARALLLSTLRDAEIRSVPQVAYRCHTSLGLLAIASGDLPLAETSFKSAVPLIEDLSAPLAVEEFRTAFIADKLIPYAELVRLCLSDAHGSHAIEALTYVEQSRSRVLLDMLGGVIESRPKPRDPFEAQMMARLAEFREELNWLYSQLYRSPDDEAPAGRAAIDDAIRQRERTVLEIGRQLQQRDAGSATRSATLDIPGLQRDLGTGTALIEYFSLDDELLAFVVTDSGVTVVRRLGRLAALQQDVEQFRFQIDALRHGASHMRRHLDQLSSRARRHLERLYAALIRPLEDVVGERRLAIVPHGVFHYLPFHALYTGSEYLIERREICYSPSASVLRHCVAKPWRAADRALLLGLPDPRIPRVRDEIVAIASSFPEPVTLLDDQATFAAFREAAPNADVIHLACHGQFRVDNPLFSSLRLADGWLTARDAYGLDLNCGLVTLSACETGMSGIMPGDELMGLARGFFSAGAPSLIVSLWTVDDEEAATFMSAFYTRLRAGDRPAAALRHAQRGSLERHEHPYFWSPFMLLGRW